MFKKPSWQASVVLNAVVALPLYASQNLEQQNGTSPNGSPHKRLAVFTTYSSPEEPNDDSRQLRTELERTKTQLEKTSLELTLSKDQNNQQKEIIAGYAGCIYTL